jgi:hypothetical protein
MQFTAAMPPLSETLHQWQTRALEKGTKQASMFAVGIPFIVITSIVVILRVHVRLRLLRVQLAADDCKFTVLGHAQKCYAHSSDSRFDDCWRILYDFTFGSEHDM